MNKVFCGGAWLALSLLAYGASPACHAQSFGSLLHSVTDKVADKVTDKAAEKAVDTISDSDSGSASAGETAAQGNRPMPVMVGGHAFAPAPLTLYQDDFDLSANGIIPKHWLTNGSGQIVNVQGFDGKWLALEAGSTFKLERGYRLPEKFTIEFDLLPLAQTPKDLKNPLFGFAGNDSTREYLSDGVNDGALNAIGLLFFNSGSNVNVFSGATGFSSNPDFDVQGYANRTLHVAIAVDGNMQQVYLDHRKILDSRMFEDNPSRYFFISAPMDYKHQAKLLFGNFRIGVYK